MSDDRFFISLCKTLICDKLDWNPEQIRQRDYEYLSHEIFKQSKVDLSTTTLRRIWSNQYKNTPQTGTLNALAQFLDFDNWNDFKLKNQVSTSKNVETRVDFSQRKAIVLVPALLVIVLGVITILTASSKPAELDLSSLKFTADKTLYEGVPATAGFEYDISKIKEKVQIELSWNPYERVTLAPNKDFYTGVYYYPDYHYSKLLIDGQAVAFQPVHVITEDWHGSLMRSDFEKRPIYLEHEELFEEDRMEVSRSIIDKYNFGPNDTLFSELVFSNPMLDTISINDLILETSVKTIDYGATRQCDRLLIYLKGEKGFAMIPLTEQGCYGELSLGFSEKWLQGKFSDLSNLETSLETWQDVRIEVSERAVQIRVALNKPLNLEYENDLGKLKAVKFLFTGLGAVDHVYLYNSNGEPLFVDDLSRSRLNH